MTAACEDQPLPSNLGDTVLGQNALALTKMHVYVKEKTCREVRENNGLMKTKNAL